MIDKLSCLLDGFLQFFLCVMLAYWVWVPEDIIGTKHLAVILTAVLWSGWRREK